MLRNLANRRVSNEEIIKEQGLTLDYRSDISGGGFLILSSDQVRCCACGSAFSRQ